MDADPSSTDSWLEVAAISEMGQAVAEFDWSSTPLGGFDTWPDGLKLAVSVCLSSRFPILVTWGPDLIKIYNDGYRQILGAEKHPLALGSPAKEVWPEVWDYIGPLFDSVMATGIPTWAEDEELVLHRSGFAEECYFTFSYSPLFDNGKIHGVLDLVAETTGHVLARRRLECLSELQRALSAAEHVTDVCARAVAATTRFPRDLRACDIYLSVEGDLVLVATNRRGDVAPVDHDELLQIAEQRVPTARGGDPDGATPSMEFIVPLGSAFGGVTGLLVLSLNPRRPFDSAYRHFGTLLADAISASLDGAFRRSSELGEYRRISDTLQASMLKPASDLPTVAARYLPAVGNLAVGGDWYDVIDLGNNQRGLIVGDCVGHGLDAATVMAQLRSAARALMLEGQAPADVLDQLDLFACSIDGAECATVVCAVFDRARRTFTYSRAGHVPPLLLQRNTSVWLDQAAGPPLTITGRSPRSNAIVAVSDDD
ncbi:MAG TPA: SpoIIE family protein phosphatase, partial [Ilumatobacteraceae bacterium]|nr:SpoIIE family protein phosphatase [Ilumatobacteraceae bacterium]